MRLALLGFESRVTLGNLYGNRNRNGNGTGGVS